MTQNVNKIVQNMKKWKKSNVIKHDKINKKQIHTHIKKIRRT